MKIYLRPITKEDSGLIVKWRNSPRVSCHCLNKNPITEESHMEYFEKNIISGYYQQYIVEREEEISGAVFYPIATVYLKDIDRVNRRCELCVFTSDDEEWNTESQSMAVKMLLDKAFNQLNMHKVYSYVFYQFIDEASLLKNAGFMSEAVLKDEAIGVDGEYSDIVRFSIFEKDWSKANTL